MDNNLNITIKISFNTLKLLQDGAYVMSNNFNRQRAKDSYKPVIMDRNYGWEKFMEMAIAEKYERELELKKQLDMADSI